MKSRRKNLPPACSYLSLLVMIFMSITCLPFSIQAASFKGLEDLDGGKRTSQAFGVSANGAVIVGQGNSKAGPEAFQWKVGGRIVGLGDLPGPKFGSTAFAVSSNGLVVVGQGISERGGQAFRWTAGKGMISLGDLPNPPPSILPKRTKYFRLISRASDVSRSGAVVVGQATSRSGLEAFRWTAETGMEGLGDLPGGKFFSSANAVSGNGSVIVGGSHSGSGDSVEAFLWTAKDGMIGLGDLPGGTFFSRADDVSTEGTVVVGIGTVENGFHAFRWTKEQGMVSLGELPGGKIFSVASSVSGDGKIIVGESKTAAGSQPIIWDSKNGIRDLQIVLTTDYNLAKEMAGWNLERATAISEDGSTIVGTGVNPMGELEGWVVNLD